MTSSQYAESPRTSPSRKRERVAYDRDVVHAVLDEAMVCHLGFVVEGCPVVLPHVHVRVGEVVYLHGSAGARALLAARTGLEVCLTVTLLDGLVLARSAFNHSVNYRSVVAHGTATVVDDDAEKTRALTSLVEAMVAGRSVGSRPPSARELAATAVLRVPLADVSVKVRAGGPADDPDDRDLPYWAGVLPLALVAGTPVAALDLPDGAVVPDHVAGWARPGRGSRPAR